jgi:Gamma interferon inducible lysosomal thiol reductase (GILT)
MLERQQLWAKRLCCTQGNVQVEVDGTPRCQHGAPECAANAAVRCALHALPATSPSGPPPSVPLTRCIFAGVFDRSRGVSRDVAAVTQRCVRQAGLSTERLDACTQGPLGQHLAVRVRCNCQLLLAPHAWALARPWHCSVRTAPPKPRAADVQCTLGCYECRRRRRRRARCSRGTRGCRGRL